MDESTNHAVKVVTCIKYLKWKMALKSELAQKGFLSGEMKKTEKYSKLFEYNENIGH